MYKFTIECIKYQIDNSFKFEKNDKKKWDIKSINEKEIKLTCISNILFLKYMIQMFKLI